MKKLIALGSRPAGRLLYCLVSLLVMVTLARAFDTAPAKTLISDVIYRADGTPATGTLVLSWPAFVTADNKAVAAGTASYPISSSGQVSLELVPNAGGNPAGTYYKVVLKLDELKTKMRWLVGNGQPGRVQQLELRVEQHEQYVQRATGISIAVAVMFTLVHLGLHYLGRL